MIPMKKSEYISHVRESFEGKYFKGKDKFLFSKAALLDGLTYLEHNSMFIEHSLDEDQFVMRDELIFVTRRLQAVANILRISLDGVHLHTQ